MAAVRADWADVVQIAMNLAAARGYAVFPCGNDKRPTIKDWPNRASADPRAIAALWMLSPGPLIGVVTGERSGIDVLDFDVKHPGALWWWQEHRASFPLTLRYRTRSGGMHAYFLHADGVRNTASKVAQGIDTRGDGGYAIHWFAHGLPCLQEAPVAPWPAELLSIIVPPPKKPVAASGTSPGGPRAWAPPNLDTAILGLVRKVATAREGERNSTLYWAANRMRARVAAAELSRAEAVALLQRAAGDAGLTEAEALRTISSGLGAA
jgi:hypothetical protein